MVVYNFIQAFSIELEYKTSLRETKSLTCPTIPVIPDVSFRSQKMVEDTFWLMKESPIHDQFYFCQELESTIVPAAGTGKDQHLELKFNFIIFVTQETGFASTIADTTWPLLTIQ